MKISTVSFIILLGFIFTACAPATQTPVKTQKPVKTVEPVQTEDPVKKCKEECDKEHAICFKDQYEKWQNLRSECKHADDKKYCNDEADATWDQMRTDCQINYYGICYHSCGDDDSEGRVVGPEQECPPGTSRDQLGRCVSLMNPSDYPEDLDPDDHCPAGTTPGPDDNCIPELFKSIVLKGAGDEWFLVCPPGTKPGPIDACIPDIPKPDDVGDDTQEPRQCPPGTAPSPDDGGCVPVFEVMELGNLFNANVIDNLIRAGELHPDSLPEDEAFLKFIGVVVTYDLEGALERTAEFLGAIPVVSE